jgi:hypothetical protein
MTNFGNVGKQIYFSVFRLLYNYNPTEKQTEKYNFREKKKKYIRLVRELLSLSNM